MTDQKYYVRSKYVDETFHRWFVFGQRQLPEGVDVYDDNLDVFVNISREAAEEFIKAKDQFVDEMERLLNKYPGTFNAISHDYRKYR
jgi:hypothetical protein